MTQERAITRINPALALQKPLEDYIQYLEKMTSRSVPLLRKLAVPGMHYTDPLHDVRGIDDIVAIFQKRFTDVRSAKYRVSDYAWGKDGQTAYLRWTFTCLRETGEDVTQGMAEVMFSNEDLVMSHTDYVCAVYEIPPPLTLWQRFRERMQARWLQKILKKRQRRALRGR